jgi:hypothetical protein
VHIGVLSISAGAAIFLSASALARLHAFPQNEGQTSRRDCQVLQKGIAAAISNPEEEFLVVDNA